MTALPNRREFIQASGGLVIAMMLPTLGKAQAPVDGKKLPAAPNAFLRIAPDDTVTVICKHIEFGQGPYTGLATLAAEELDADWSQMRAESAPADQKLYANLNMGVQGTGGSSAMANSYYQMRKAGAAARAMLVAAAAKEWRVSPSQILVSKGVLTGPGGRSARFGDFAAAAATMTAPPNPKLKDPAQFQLIGTRVSKLDSGAKSTGGTQFTIDVTRPNMVHSAILHPPSFGSVVTRVNSDAAEAIPGVLGVRRVPQGVAVYANSTWAAQKGVAALVVDYDSSKAETRSSEDLFRAYSAAARAPGVEVEKSGAGAAGLAGAVKTLEAEIWFPFLAHATMEPNDAVVELGRNQAEIWMGSQVQTLDHQGISKALGLPLNRVRINTMYAGGSFGRRASPGAEFAVEAATVAKAWGKNPVKHVWTRENDIRGGFYRPLAVHRLRGGLDAQNNIIGWDQVIAIQSFVAGTPFEAMVVQNGIDSTAVEGAKGMPYERIANRRIGLHLMKNNIPTLWWRSVGHTHTGYAVETFIDELLALGGKDAVEGRLALMGEKEARLAGALRRVAEIADWSGPKARDARFRGVAAVESFGSFVAQIAEVSRGANGLPKVHKVWCAVDCGVAINPDVIAAQVEGGVGFALGHALYGEINIEEGGRVREGNFDTYRSLRIDEMPEVEVAIVRSSEDPTGIGEPGVPPLAPAVANAWRALTSKPVRRLPFTRGVAA